MLKRNIANFLPACLSVGCGICLVLFDFALLFEVGFCCATLTGWVLQKLLKMTLNLWQTFQPWPLKCWDSIQLPRTLDLNIHCNQKNYNILYEAKSLDALLIFDFHILSITSWIYHLSLPLPEEERPLDYIPVLRNYLKPVLPLISLYLQYEFISVGLTWLNV